MTTGPGPARLVFLIGAVMAPREIFLAVGGILVLVRLFLEGSPRDTPLLVLGLLPPDPGLWTKQPLLVIIPRLPRQQRQT